LFTDLSVLPGVSPSYRVSGRVLPMYAVTVR
jgi:hypothetical protein